MALPDLSSETLRARRPWVACVLLIAAYLVMRLPHLTDSPVFCDEAAYLRWGQLIRADPLHNYWVSMRDYKLPIHYWLLAIFYVPGADPLYAGRLLSVMTGAALIPVLLALGGELAAAAAFRKNASAERAARWFGPLACAFMITSPIFGSYQRMAVAEPLLLLESVILGVLSLRLGRMLAAARKADGAEGAAAGRKRGLWREPYATAVVLGAAWAVTLLTKQNFSYLLWMFPPLGVGLYLTAANWRGVVKAAIGPLVVATAIGVIFFLPAVLTTNVETLKLNLFYKPMFFRVPAAGRFEVFLENLAVIMSPRADHHVQWWPHDPAAPLDEGVLYLYLTPMVFLFTLAGAVWLLCRRAMMPIAFFGTWTVILLGSVIVNFSWIRTRYALLGIFPLLLLGAWITAEVVAMAGARGKDARAGRWRYPVIRVGVVAGILAWPLMASTAQLVDVSAPTKTRYERQEYLTRFSAGRSVQTAVAWLEEQAARQPITVITHTGFWNENDFVWLMLESNPNVQLLASELMPSTLPPVNADGTRTFCTEQWFPERTAKVRLDPGRPTFTLQGLNPNAGGVFVCNPEPRALSPQARLVQVIPNPPTTPREGPDYATGIVEIYPGVGMARAGGED